MDYDWGVFSTGVTRSDKLSCQPRIPAEFHRDEERKVLNGLVPFLADDIKGQNYPEHGDCLHWIQPGVPDIYAAQFADSIVEEMSV